MNKIPNRGDWRGELQAIGLLTLMFLIIFGLLWLSAALKVWRL